MGLTGDLMKIGSKILGKATAELAKVPGGELVKAKLVVADDGASVPKEFNFEFNPASITVVKSVNYTQHKQQISPGGSQEFTAEDSTTIEIPEIYFDTLCEEYHKNNEKNVRKAYIDTLEKYMQIQNVGKNEHRPPKLFFNWGSFTDTYNALKSKKWYLTSLNVEYLIFLNDGTPVRAKVKLTLSDATKIEEKMNVGETHSSDDAKVHTVMGNETLDRIANRHYGNSSEWRRIADVNNIDDPMNISPGIKLLIPPILK